MSYKGKDWRKVHSRDGRGERAVVRVGAVTGVQRLEVLLELGGTRTAAGKNKSVSYPSRERRRETHLLWKVTVCDSAATSAAPAKRTTALTTENMVDD